MIDPITNSLENTDGVDCVEDLERVRRWIDGQRWEVRKEIQSLATTGEWEKRFILIGQDTMLVKMQHEILSLLDDPNSLIHGPVEPVCSMDLPIRTKELLESQGWSLDYETYHRHYPAMTLRQEYTKRTEDEVLELNLRFNRKDSVFHRSNREVFNQRKRFNIHELEEFMKSEGIWNGDY